MAMNQFGCFEQSAMTASQQIVPSVRFDRDDGSLDMARSIISIADVIGISKSPKFMQVAFRAYVGRVGFLWRIVRTDKDSCHPPAVRTERDTQEPRPTTFMWSQQILRILTTRCVAQIAESIIKRIAVFVVHKLLRPAPSHVKPREARCQVSSPSYTYYSVFFAVPFASTQIRNGTYAAVLALWACARTARRKYSRLSIVIQQIFELPLRYHFCSHSRTSNALVVRGSGAYQRPRSSLSCAGPLLAVK